MSSIEKMVERITGDPPMEIFEDQGWFSITVESKEAERKLLAAKGKKVTGGHIIKILPSRYKMRPHEIFDWLLDTARVEERTGNLHFQSVIVPRNRSPVRVVDAQKEDKKDEKNSPQSRPPTPPKVQFSEQKKSDSPNGENNKGVKGKGKWGWQPQPKGGGKGKGKGTGGRGFPNNSGTNSQNIQSNQNYNPPHKIGAIRLRILMVRHSQIFIHSHIIPQRNKITKLLSHLHHNCRTPRTHTNSRPESTCP
jgi:hypothetical protein